LLPITVYGTISSWQLWDKRRNYTEKSHQFRLPTFKNCHCHKITKITVANFTGSVQCSKLVSQTPKLSCVAFLPSPYPNSRWSQSFNDFFDNQSPNIPLLLFWAGYILLYWESIVSRVISAYESCANSISRGHAANRNAEIILRLFHITWFMAFWDDSRIWDDRRLIMIRASRKKSKNQLVSFKNHFKWCQTRTNFFESQIELIFCVSIRVVWRQKVIFRKSSRINP